ncbi:hypothetical protein MASR2M29_22510 [Spirochaetota bacterium]
MEAKGVKELLDEPAFLKPVPASGQALLLSGPNPGNGLPGFGLNAIPSIAGEYIVAPDSSSEQLPAQTTEIGLWFTMELLYYGDNWEAASCDALRADIQLYVREEAGGSSLWAASFSDYSIILRFPPDFKNKCQFLAIFEDRFSFFYRYREGPEDISFPAVLELSSK